MNNHHNKPNLFLVGAQKCGTTSVHHYLASHTDIFMSPTKEPRYFCKDLIEESDTFAQSQPPHLRKESLFKFRTMDDYLSLFNDADGYKIKGESSPVYIYSKVAARNIAEFNPDARIIILLRNPVDFLYSLHATYLLGNIEIEQSFEKALFLEPRRKKGEMIPPGAGCPSLLYYSDHARFSEQIMRYITHFSTDQIHISLQEDLKINRVKEFNKILNHLGLHHTHNIPDIEYNKNKVTKYPKVKKIITTPQLTYFARSVIPNTIYSSVSNYIAKVALTTTMRRPELNKSTIRQMKRNYNSEVALLNDMLNDYGLISTNLINRWGFDA